MQSAVEDDTDTQGDRRQREPGGPQNVEIVIVTYFSRDNLLALLPSIPCDQPIVVVDNASGADGVREIIEGLANARWLDGRNSGFAKAANLGARTSQADYLVFADPDSRPTATLVAALVDDLRQDATLAIVGAGSIDDSGRLELGVGGWEPTLPRVMAYAFGLHRVFPKSGVYASPRHREDIELGWLGAPCMAMRRRTFEKLGGFDERYFVYNEDMAFGRTVRTAGLTQRLRTDLNVSHEASTSGGGGTAMLQQRGASMAAYLHHHNVAAKATAMRGILILGAAFRVMMATMLRQHSRRRQQAAYIIGVACKRSPFER